MGKRNVGRRAGAAVLLCGACGLGIFHVDASPFIASPAYAGIWHPWIATLSLGGLLIGAAFFRSRWGRAYAFASAVALIAFEFFDFIARMPSQIPLGRSVSPVAAAVAGLFVFLHLLPELVAPSGDG